MLKYKLTDEGMQTYCGCQWEVGVPKETNGEGELCGPGWLHYYHDPRTAVLLNPVHAGFPYPRLWECEAEGEHKDDRGRKGGCTKLTLLREVPLPKYDPKVLAVLAVSVALASVPEADEPEFCAWARAWLDSGGAADPVGVRELFSRRSMSWLFEERNRGLYNAVLIASALAGFHTLYEPTTYAADAIGINFSEETLPLLEQVLAEAGEG